MESRSLGILRKLAQPLIIKNNFNTDAGDRRLNCIGPANIMK